jgi:hypothetical protein
MTLTLSHFSAAIIFAFFASIVFGITQKNTKPEMIRYAIQSFIFFVVGTILAGWAMAALRYFAIKN